jgi:DNA polymerase III sliding clamp (beta) subunit (PCNA family)
MDIKVANLREVLGLLKPVVPRKSSVEVLTNVLISNGQATATNLETAVIIAVPEAEADDGFLLPYTNVIEMLQFIQGGETLHIEKEVGSIVMSWSEGKTSFLAGNIEDYPSLDEFKSTAEATLDSDALIPAMVAVLPYASREESRPILQGVTLAMGKPFHVAASDGFRMAYQVLPLSFPDNINAIVPSHAVSVLNHLWEKTPRTPPPAVSLVSAITAKRQVSVAYDGKKMKFIFGKYATAIVTLIEGTSPSFVKLIPKDEPILQVQIMAVELLYAVRRALQVAKGGSDIIRMVFNDSTVTVSSVADGKKIESQIRTLSVKGAPNKVGFNANYLLDYLKEKDGIISMSWTGGTRPVVFQYHNNPKALIMPMAVQWDAAPPGESQPEAEPAPPAASPEPEPAAEKPSEPTQTPEIPTKKSRARVKASPEAAKPSKQRGKKEKA